MAFISYTQTHAKVSWKYDAYRDFKDLKIKDLEEEIGHCYGSKQYIMRFIEMLKDRVIRTLPDLSKVNIMLTVYDKNNVIHRVIVKIHQLIHRHFHKQMNDDNIYYNTIFTTIEYAGEIVFVGCICFYRID